VTGGTLILPVFFLYLELAMLDVMSWFVRDMTFGAYDAVMFPHACIFTTAMVIHGREKHG